LLRLFSGRRRWPTQMSIGNRLKLLTRPSTKTLETTGGCHGSGLRSGNSAIASTQCISLYHLDSLKILALILAGWCERCQQSRIYQLFSSQTFTFGVLVKDFSAKTVPDYASFWCSSTISRRDLWLGRWRTQLNKCSLSSLSATSSTKKNKFNFNTVILTALISISFMIRNTSPVGWVPLLGYKVLFEGSLLPFIKSGILVALPILFFLVWVDTTHYNSDKWVFTGWNFLEMNVLHGLSKYFGEEPWY